MTELLYRNNIAIMMATTDKFKQHQLVEYEAKSGKQGLRHAVYHLETSEAEIVELGMFERLPPLCEFHAALSKLAGNYGIMFSATTQRFTVTGFRFGKACRVSVPVFKDGKVESQKFVSSTRHINVSGETFEECSIKLWRYCMSGKLFGFYSVGRLERLYWDAEFNQLSTQHVSRDSLKIK